MDEKPRMVTAALNDNMWVAYSAQHATLYKAWKGGVNYDGAVYTTVHGPQPTSKGYAYVQNEEDEQWLLKKGTQTNAASVRYRGHRLLDGQVIFNLDLITPEGGKISNSGKTGICSAWKPKWSG